MVVWGSFHPITKLLLEDVPPFTTAFFRVLLSFVFFFPFLFSRKWFPKIEFKDSKMVLASAFFGMVLSSILLMWGLKLSTAASSSILFNTSPFFVILLTLFFLRKKPTLSQIIGLSIGFLGVSFIVSNGVFAPLSDPTYFLGNILLVLGAFSMAIYTIIGTNVSVKFGGIAGQTLLAIFSLPFLFLLFLFSGGVSALSNISLVNWAGLLYIGAIIMGGCWSVFLFSLKEIGPVDASIFKLLIPASGAFISVIFLKETITPFFLVGALSVIFGLFFVLKSSSTWQ